MSLVLFLFLFNNLNANAQSIKLDSTSNPVDTLKQAKGGLDDIVKYKSDDSIILDLEARVVHLYGNAEVKYDDIELNAGYIRIDFSLKELCAKGIKDSAGIIVGIPHFKQDGNEFDADSLCYNFDTKRAKLTAMRLEHDGSYIHCDKVYRDSDGSIKTNTGKFTTCNLDHPHFYFKANKLKVIPDNKVVFGPANLVLEDVETPLYLPFGLFPIKKDRKSGLVFPKPEMGGIRGFGLQNLGWHFHISEQFNLTLNSDIYFGGSYRIGAASQYSKRYKYNGNVNLSYGYNITQGTKEENNLIASNDYSISWQHYENAKNHPGRTFSANIRLNGGKFNENYIQNTQNFGNSQFTSSVSYSKVLVKNWLNLNASASASQNTSTSSLTATAPAVALTMQRKFVKDFLGKKSNSEKHWYDNLGVSYTGNFSNNISRADSNLLDLSTWETPWREANKVVNHTVPVSMSISFLNNYFTMSPYLNYSENWYFKTIDLAVTSDNVLDTLSFDRNSFGRQHTWNVGTDLRTNVFGTYNLKSNKVRAIRHILTPTVGFRYTPDFTQDKFSFTDSYLDTGSNKIVYNRFTGQGMQPGEQGFINFSLANVVSGKKILPDSSNEDPTLNLIDQLTFSSGYNLLADSFNWSNVSSSFNTSLFNRKLNFNASASFSPYKLSDEGVRIDELFIKNNIGLAQIQSANIGLTASFRPKGAEEREKQIRESIGEENRYMYNLIRSQLLDFEIPWSINISTNARYNPFADVNVKKWSLVPSFNGDLSISPLWKVTYNSGYDLINKNIAETTRIGLARSLHCWVIEFDWTPIGTRRSFTFTLRPNASMLQDLKLSKRSYWWQ